MEKNWGDTPSVTLNIVQGQVSASSCDVTGIQCQFSLNSQTLVYRVLLFKWLLCIDDIG